MKKKASKINIKTTTIIFIIFWDFMMFYQIFHSPQMKRRAIDTYNHGIYDFPHKLEKYQESA